MHAQYIFPKCFRIFVNYTPIYTGNRVMSYIYNNCKQQTNKVQNCKGQSNKPKSQIPSRLDF